MKPSGGDHKVVAFVLRFWTTNHQIWWLFLRSTARPTKIPNVELLFATLTFFFIIKLIKHPKKMLLWVWRQFIYGKTQYNRGLKLKRTKKKHEISFQNNCKNSKIKNLVFWRDLKCQTLDLRIWVRTRERKVRVKE